jgi:hypothetical protein
LQQQANNLLQGFLCPTTNKIRKTVKQRGKMINLLFITHKMLHTTNRQKPAYCDNHAEKQGSLVDFVFWFCYNVWGQKRGQGVCGSFPFM